MTEWRRWGLDVADDDYKYLRDKVDSIFKRTEQIPVIILRLDGLNDFKAKCEEDRDKFEDRVASLETGVVSDEKVEEFKRETRKTRRWLIGIFITVIIFIGTMAYQKVTVRAEGASAPQYCNCRESNYCICNKDACGCVECRTAIIEREDYNQ